MYLVFSKSKLFVFLAVVFVAISLSIIAPASFAKETITAISDPDSATVVLDPGHGGEDGGADGVKGKKEKFLNLELSEKIKKNLEVAGVRVIMTRDTDVSLHDPSDKTATRKNQDLSSRIKIANQSGADLFLSIHMNEFDQKQVKGAHAFFNDVGAAKYFATAIQNEIKKDVDQNNKRVAVQNEKNVIVLRKATIPAVIVECGFLSNPEEEALLNSPEYQEKLASAISNAVVGQFKVTQAKTP